ncbi:MAG: hypothetical protein ACON5B_04635 [Myxococcota bacterium]
MKERGSSGQIDRDKGTPRGEGILPGEGMLPGEGIPKAAGRPRGTGILPGAHQQMHRGSSGQVDRGAPGQMDRDADNPWAVDPSTEGYEPPPGMMDMAASDGDADSPDEPSSPTED